MGFGFRRDDVEDAAQEATLYAMRQIAKFKTDRGTSAFSYFTTVVFKALSKYRQKLDRERGMTGRNVAGEGRGDAMTR